MITITIPWIPTILAVIVFVVFYQRFASSEGEPSMPVVSLVASVVVFFFAYGILSLFGCI